jgi:hypothetical protein
MTQLACGLARFASHGYAQNFKSYSQPTCLQLASAQSRNKL